MLRLLHLFVFGFTWDKKELCISLHQFRTFSQKDGFILHYYVGRFFKVGFVGHCCIVALRLISQVCFAKNIWLVEACIWRDNTNSLADLSEFSYCLDN
jgi:hypothetical protein